MKDTVIEFMYKTIKIPYSYFFKNNEPWGVTVSSLLQNETGTLGHDLGQFLSINNYQVQDSLEEHDVFHVLTKIGTTVKEEIDMQFYLSGNGKKSSFGFIVISTGIFFYPNHYKSFIHCYKRGKNAYQFYDLDFHKLLHQPTSIIQSIFKIN